MKEAFITYFSYYSIPLSQNSFETFKIPARVTWTVLYLNYIIIEFYFPKNRQNIRISFHVYAELNYHRNVLLALNPTFLKFIKMSNIIPFYQKTSMNDSTCNEYL